jgi:cell division protein FtsB
MRQRAAKRELRRRADTKGWLRRAGVYAGGALLVLVLMHTLFGPYGYLSMRRSQHEIEKLREEIDRLDRENAHLSGEIRALQTDPAAIEKVAREDMGLARPGEMIYRLQDEASAPKPPAEKNTPEQ